LGFFSRVRKVFRARASPADPPISVSVDGFAVSGRSISWHDIQEISAYKIDLFTVDEVRFSLSVSSGPDVVVSEEQHGFSELVTSLALQFPSVAGWERKVIHPAFARNQTMLYRRTPTHMVLADVCYELFPHEAGWLGLDEDAGWHQLDGQVRLDFAHGATQFISWGKGPVQYSVEIRDVPFFSEGALTSLEMSTHPYWRALVGQNLDIAYADEHHQVLKLFNQHSEVFLSSQYPDGAFQGDCIRVSPRAPVGQSISAPPA
jgi:hypothetical protein